MDKQRQLRINLESILKNTATLKTSLQTEMKTEVLNLFILMEQPLTWESPVMLFFQVDQLVFQQIDLLEHFIWVLKEENCLFLDQFSSLMMIFLKKKIIRKFKMQFLTGCYMIKVILNKV